MCALEPWAKATESAPVRISCHPRGQTQTIDHARELQSVSNALRSFGGGLDHNHLVAVAAPKPLEGASVHHDAVRHGLDILAKARPCNVLLQRLSDESNSMRAHASSSDLCNVLSASTPPTMLQIQHFDFPLEAPTASASAGMPLPIDGSANKPECKTVEQLSVRNDASPVVAVRNHSCRQAAFAERRCPFAAMMFSSDSPASSCNAPELHRRAANGGNPLGSQSRYFLSASPLRQG